VETGPSSRIRAKIDYTLPVGKNDKFEAGFQTRFFQEVKTIPNFTFLIPVMASTTSSPSTVTSLLTLEIFMRYIQFMQEKLENLDIREELGLSTPSEI